MIKPDVLMDADTLAGLILSITPTTDGPTVLDVRWHLTGPGAAGPSGRVEFDAGHLPRAAFVDLDADLCGPPGAAGRHPLPDPGVLQRALRGAGVRGDLPVVVYDGGDGMAAARLWWTLCWAGHPDVRILDGGFPAWRRAGHRVEVEIEVPQPGDFTVAGGHLPVLDAASAGALAGGGVLLDARAAPRYRGETEPIDPVAGHIPGARNLPLADLVGADGRLRPADELRAVFAAAGVEPGTATGAYCGSGVTAAHTVMALTVAGVDGAALYVGSWSEWITDPDRPIATGEQP